LKVKLVVNPIAGNRAFKYIDRIKSALEKKASVDLFLTDKQGDAWKTVQESSDTDRIIVASGDGTINEVVNGLMEAGIDLPVGLIPLGVTNVLARELELPEDVMEAADRALEGSPRRIALGRINGRYFTLMAGIGFDGEVVMNVERGGLKKISGKGAHIVSAIKLLFSYDPPLINVKTPEDDLYGYTVVVSNARCYGGQFFVTPEASLYEPRLDICILKGAGRMALARLAASVILKRRKESKFVSYLQTRELELSSGGRCHVQIDGDYFGTLPAKIEVIPDAVRFIC
jgi:YegS/Rv2252/BmrU family lipid kinase